jgi:hypothetical protein
VANQNYTIFPDSIPRKNPNLTFLGNGMRDFLDNFVRGLFRTACFILSRDWHGKEWTQLNCFDQTITSDSSTSPKLIVSRLYNPLFNPIQTSKTSSSSSQKKEMTSISNIPSKKRRSAKTRRQTDIAIFWHTMKRGLRSVKICFLQRLKENRLRDVFFCSKSRQVTRQRFFGA